MAPQVTPEMMLNSITPQGDESSAQPPRTDVTLENKPRGEQVPARACGWWEPTTGWPLWETGQRCSNN